MASQRIMVIGGTGQVGRPLVRRLRATGADVVVAARHPGAGGVALDLADTVSLAKAARGFDAAYLTTPLGPQETRIGLGAVDALVAAGVGKIVYLAAHQLDAMAAIPHFATKIPIRDAICATASGVVLAPNFFFQNDLLVRDAIVRGGVYPLPVGFAGVWSIDVEDIAVAAARALTQSRWDGQVVPLCGPDRLTGNDLAANWAQALGRPVAYGGDAIAPFIDAMKAKVPGFEAWFAHDFERMMQVTQMLGCPASDADCAATRSIVGRAPRSHTAFAREAVQNAAHSATGD
ncbi:SDR family oxidoreductase [Sphingobium algorifonticola]|uniref:NAD-dependent epimerase/dehydratase family protein n=1 Tax=Sphingobium algorifonticola TaxID=2008318 RepID=A0A437J9U9_9SPHN|nr:NmrA family NAD(P)-binding protein [Sphingobium algorifonticola]RVT42278.1 NAD-dependent epimerase/dehydratase family protein [Sphingobium algorifonticola]